MQREVDNLRGQFSSLVRNMEDRVDDLVAQSKVDRQLTQVKSLEADSMWTAKQNSLAALKSDWVRVRNLAKCMDRQLEHQSNYHLFYQTLKEYQTALEAAFACVKGELAGQRFTGAKDEAKWLFDEMQKLITTVLQWWQRIDSLIIQSRKVLPMSVRLGPLDMKRPGKILVDFEAARGQTLKVNDDVFVVDTSDRDVWTVETAQGQEVSMPSMCVAVSGPDPDVMERALAVRTLLLSDWTSTLKEVGRSLVSFTLSVFRQKSTAEADSLNETSLDGRDLQPLLGIMEKLLQTYWTKHPEFEDMAERISKARVSMAIYDDNDDIDDYTHIDINTLFLQLSPLAMSGNEPADDSARDGIASQKMLTLLMRKYQELMKYWEVYKILVETSNDPNYFWMMEEFQKLRYINVTELLNFLASEDKETWLHYINQMMGRSGRKLAEPIVTPATLEHDLDLRPESLRLVDPGSAQVKSRVLVDLGESRGTFVQSDRQPHVGGEVVAEIFNAELNNGHSDATDGEPVTFTSTASLQVNSEAEDEAEERQRPKPRPPTPPRPREQPQPLRPTELPLSPTAAASEEASPGSGVRDRVAALERSLSLKESPSGGSTSPKQRPLSRSPSAATAARQGAAVEEFKRDEVEQSSRIVISGVVDTLNNSTLSLQEAIDRGVIHSESGSYLNRAKNVWIPIPVAMSEGLIIAEQQMVQQREVQKQQVYAIVTFKSGGGGGVGGGVGGAPSFVVTAVHDRSRRSKLSPAEAQLADLADASLSQFYDSERREWVGVSEAADRGIIEYDVGPSGGGGGGGPDVSYVVYSVVDVVNKASVSFKEASEKGLVDIDEGVFVNSRTRERLEFDEAISKGFLKADRVTGPVSQVAGAEQRVVVNRLRSARSRIQTAARALRGFGGGNA